MIRYNARKWLYSSHFPSKAKKDNDKLERRGYYIQCSKSKKSLRRIVRWCNRVEIASIKRWRCGVRVKVIDVEEESKALAAILGIRIYALYRIEWI